MQTVIHSLQQFKSPAKRPVEGPQETPLEEAREFVSEDENDILCASCLGVLTGKDQRMEIQGSHKHIFSNPHGFVYEIGCFGSARCQYAGQPTEEFSWFRGFRWRFAVCARCLTHLGWLFISPSSHQFHGLILDRLIFPGGPAA
jgi:hypothetical protein